jgi:imidazole glycerol-phosphate synthase subunit HisH
MTPITIVDYGMGNLGSIQNMFKRIGVSAAITRDLEQISQASKLVLPGVGAFDAAMTRIKNNQLIPVLNHKALVEKIPILGICLGMQLLTHGSEEGNQPGLGWIDASCHRFSAEANLKVPHMGWNRVIPMAKNLLIEDLPAEARFYFVHSYYVKTQKPENVVLEATYGISFAAAIQRNNIVGTQFHPEKSHRFGMKLLENFARS